jgi:rsbT co-antagonist protein RsbR
MTHESGFPFRETQLHLSESEIALRKRWLDFNERDEAILREEIDPLVDGSIDQLISEMYRHFLTFDETRSFFPDDAVLKRAQTAQKQYFSRLTKGN